MTDTIAEKFALRDAFRRGQLFLVPIVGFYQGQKRPTVGNKPWVIAGTDGKPLSLVGAADASKSQRRPLRRAATVDRGAG